MQDDLANQAGHQLDAAFRAALPDEPGARGARRHRGRRRLAAVEMDEELSSVGSQPQDLCLPENWIEPELRDDKSPFFKELESELLQGDLTKETAETAFRHYLDKLDQVARLEIVGTYHQVEGKDIDILHVFGRTEGIPHVYYYRRWVKQSYWTAWERVDLDIEGDHLIPVVWNHRLYLFWPIFTEKTEPLQVNIKSGNFTSSDPEKKWEIKLAWSEHKQGKWANKKVSSSSSNDLDVNQYIFSVRKIKDDLQRFLGRWRIDQHNALTIVVGHERPYNVMGHKGDLLLLFGYIQCVKVLLFDLITVTAILRLSTNHIRFMRSRWEQTSHACFSRGWQASKSFFFRPLLIPRP